MRWLILAAALFLGARAGAQGLSASQQYIPMGGAITLTVWDTNRAGWPFAPRFYRVAASWGLLGQPVILTNAWFGTSFWWLAPDSLFAWTIWNGKPPNLLKPAHGALNPVTGMATVTLSCPPFGPLQSRGAVAGLRVFLQAEIAWDYYGSVPVATTNPIIVVVVP